MALINAETKLCDVILNEPALIPVINRFGIILGVFMLIICPTILWIVDLITTIVYDKVL